jgi:HlyD family secretion protein
MGEQQSTGTTAAIAPGQNRSSAGPVAAGPPHAPRKKTGAPKFLRNLFLLAILATAGVAAYYGWQSMQPPKLPDGFVSSNGRLEATEIDMATKLPGRIGNIAVDEGDMVTAGQVVAHMNTEVLNAQRKEAEAKRDEAVSAIITANKTVEQRQEEKAAVLAIVKQRVAELDLAKKRLVRTEGLEKRGGASKEDLDIRQADLASAEAALSKSKADVAAADAAIATAESLVLRSKSSLVAAKESIARIQADINDSTLKAPRAGRVQYRVAQPGEVLPAGGKVLNMIDLNDVYMTFFLPTAWAGRVKLGAEVRIVLDAAPQFVFPAKVTFVADVAQFTPKTVETAEERQKLTFRAKAHIPADLLQKYIRDVKTGLPGMAYVQLDPQAKWPANLEVKLPQ